MENTRTPSAESQPELRIITEQEADALRDYKVPSTAEAPLTGETDALAETTLKKLGMTAFEGQGVALVIRTNEAGEETGVKYIDLGSDLGTRMRDLEKRENPADALVRIRKAEADAAAPSTEMAEAKSAAVVNAKAEEAKPEPVATELAQPAAAPSRAEETAPAEQAELSKQDQTMAELRDRWGLRQEATPADALRGLQATAEGLQDVLARFGNGELEPAVGEVSRKLRETVGGFYNGQGEVRVAPHDIDRAQQQLAGLQTEVNRLVQSNTALLPTNERSRLGENAGRIRSINNALESTLVGNNFRVDDADASIHLLHNGTLEDVRQTTARVKTLVEEMQVSLQGQVEPAAEQAATEQFADDRIAELAKQLRAEGVNDEVVAQAVNSMERHLDDLITESKNLREAGLPHIEYPERAVSTTDQAPRRYGAKAGERISSRQLTAEMAVDMLRGTFDVAQANHDEIEVVSGWATLGQHRAAALMELYGKDWQEAGKRAGHNIVVK